MQSSGAASQVSKDSVLDVQLAETLIVDYLNTSSKAERCGVLVFRKMTVERFAEYVKERFALVGPVEVKAGREGKLVPLQPGTLEQNGEFVWVQVRPKDQKPEEKKDGGFWDKFLKKAKEVCAVMAKSRDLEDQQLMLAMQLSLIPGAARDPAGLDRISKGSSSPLPESSSDFFHDVHNRQEADDRGGGEEEYAASRVPFCR